MFSLEYAEVTRTASATFHDRQGNCLSFTMLFVGLARAAGLTASYQSVEVPPTWSNDGQVVIANHVNAVVRRASAKNRRRLQHSRATGRPHSRRVSDSYALGLVLYEPGRRSAAARRVRREASPTCARPRACIPTSPGCGSTRSPVRAPRPLRARGGGLFACARDRRGRAVGARRISRSSTSARRAGARSRISRARARLSRAQSLLSYRVGDTRVREAAVRGALASLRKAMRLKPDEHEFYELRGQALTALGKSRDGEAQLRARTRVRGHRRRAPRVARALRRDSDASVTPSVLRIRRRKFCTRWPVLTSVV